MAIFELKTRDTQFDAAAALKWWNSLQSDPKKNLRGDPAARAEMRRADAVREIHLVPAFEILRRALPDARVDDLAVVGSVLSHVREHDATASVAEQLGRPTAVGGSPPMNPLRFKRLLQVQGPDQRIAAGARIVRLLRGRANIEDLAWSFYAWDDAADEVHRSWARAYYGALPADEMKRSEG